MKIGNKVRKFLVLALAAIMLVGATACKQGSISSSQGSTDKPSGPMQYDNKIKQTNELMAVNGMTDYTVVVPAKPTGYELDAQDELLLFLEMSIGISFPVVADTGLGFDENKKYISVGRTVLFDKTDLTADAEELGVTGYIIKTIGKSVFICGGDTIGTLFGVYEFLEHTIGYEYYAEEEIAINTLTKLYLYDFDVTTVPSFQYNYLSTSLYLNDPYGWNRRKNCSPFINTGLGAHGSFVLINPDVYNKPEKPETYHPEWFAIDENGAVLNQLNYTAGEELVNEMVKNIIGDPALGYDPEKSMLPNGYLNIVESYKPENYKSEQIYFHIGIEDYWGWDKRPESVALKEKYGTDAASLVLFFNQVAEKVRAWLDINQPDRELYISYFAYQDTERPPVKYDANGDLVRDKNGDPIPVDDSVRMHESTVVRLAPINANWYESFASDANKKTQNVLEGWSALGKTMIWLYSIGFSSQYAQFNNFNSLQATYQYVKENLNLVHCYDEYLTTGKGNPCFRDYRAYIQSELMWNVYADYEQLTENFFRNYYRDAADIMLKYLEELRVLYMDNWELVGLAGDCNTANLYLPALWPKGTLLSWKGYIDAAYSSIAHYAMYNPELYAKLRERIEMESLSIRYLLIKLYPEVYTEKELYAEKVEFYDLVVKYDMWRKNAEADTFEKLKSDLGI